MLGLIITEFASTVDCIFQHYIMGNVLINAVTIFKESLMDRFLVGMEY